MYILCIYEHILYMSVFHPKHSASTHPPTAYDSCVRRFAYAFVYNYVCTVGVYELMCIGVLCVVLIFNSRTPTQILVREGGGG